MVFDGGPCNKIGIERETHILQRDIPACTDRLASRRDADTAAVAAGNDAASVCRNLFGNEFPFESDVHLVKRVGVLKHSAGQNTRPVNTKPRPLADLFEQIRFLARRSPFYLHEILCNFLSNKKQVIFMSRRSFGSDTR